MILNLSQYEGYERGIDLRVYTQHPISGIREGRAFYRIFFGEE
jgi:hypothetical protein